MLWSVPIFFLHGLSKVSARNNYIVNMPTRWPASFSSSRQAGSTETVVVLLFLFLSPGSLCLFFSMDRKQEKIVLVGRCRRVGLYVFSSRTLFKHTKTCIVVSPLAIFLFLKRKRKIFGWHFILIFHFRQLSLLNFLYYNTY